MVTGIIDFTKNVNRILSNGLRHPKVGEFETGLNKIFRYYSVTPHSDSVLVNVLSYDPTKNGAGLTL